MTPFAQESRAITSGAAQADPPPPEQPRQQPGGLPATWTLVLGLAFLVVALVALVGGGIVTLRHLGQHRTELTTTLDGPVRQVVAETDTGDVHVHQGRSGQPLVVRRILRWGVERPTETVVKDGEVVTVTGRCLRAALVENCSVDLDVTLPAGTAARLTTRTGDITAENVDGAFEATTRTGDVRLRGLRSASVIASTTTGDLSVNLAVPPMSVRARTSTGDLRLTVPADGTAYHVTASTADGEEAVRLPVDPHATHSIAASVTIGDLTLAATP